MRISDWSSDVCSSDLIVGEVPQLCDLAFQLGDRLFEVEEIVHVSLSSTAFGAGHTPKSAGRISTFARFALPHAAKRRWHQAAGASLARMQASSEERRVGKEGCSTCRSWGARYHKKK